MNNLKITIELNLEIPEGEPWVLTIHTAETVEGFPAYLSTHRFVEDAIEDAKNWVSSTSYI